jgi:predicted O-methyltransferase YrrM
MVYTFTNDYFGTSEIKSTIEDNFDKTDGWKILEIGSFEGSSAVYFSDNMLDHPGATLTCVDPFESSDPTTPFTMSGTDTLVRFVDNISQSKNFQKITVRKMYSSEFYKMNTNKFNFIYVDGSHLLEDIQLDFRECLKILDLGGFIAFDDYKWGDGSIKKCIDDLYEENKDTLSLLGSNYQIMFQKVSNSSNRIL